MTSRLTEALTATAEEAPPVPPADRLWRRGRRSRRRRRTAAALACLLLAAAVVWLPPAGSSTPDAGGTGPQVLPADVARPYLWQRTFEGDPNGPVKLVFTTGHSLNLETAAVLVGQDDSYRLIYLAPGGDAGSPSPDGRWLLHRELLDLTTGKTRGLERPLNGHSPPVWAPDGQTAAGWIGPDTISYGNDGLPIPGQDAEIVLVDVATGAVRPIARVPGGSTWSVAFSPSGDRIAVQYAGADPTGQLLILDTATGQTLRTVRLSDRQRLAGPAAWMLGGSHIVLALGEACPWTAMCPDQTWRLQWLAVDTAEITDEAVRGQPGSPSLVAWRDGEPVVQRSSADGFRCETIALTGSGARRLPLAVDGDRCADYARDLLERGVLGGPAIGPSVWQAQWWAYVPPALLVLLLTLIARRALSRRRSPVIKAPLKSF